MGFANESPYLERLLKLYDEKRRRFQLTFTLLWLGAFAFFFFVFFPYLTLLGNRADCQAQQMQCTQLETSILEERFTEVTTSWGNIPISTTEVVTLFPPMVAIGLLVAASQLVELMRLQQAIHRQLKSLNAPVEVTLIAPLLLDPHRRLLDWVVGGMAFLSPALLGLFSINLLAVRLTELRANLPYVQAPVFYQFIYGLSALMMGIACWRVAGQFWQVLWSQWRSP